MNRTSPQLAAVPAYFSPGADWGRLTAGHPEVAMAILNLEDGPGTRPDPEVALRVTQASRAGVEMLGYVDTANGQRPLSDVLDDVARYRAWYQIGGVFLDQAHVPAPVVQHYYRPLYQSLKAAERHRSVVLNAGAAMPRSVMGATDVLADFEGDYRAYLQWTPASWSSAYKASRFWHIVYGIPGLDELDQVMTISQSRGAGWLYATDQPPHEDRPGSHLYDRLPRPRHWSRFLEGLTDTAARHRVPSPAPQPASAAHPIGDLS